MTIRPRQIARSSCSLALAAGFNEWRYDAGLLINILDYLHNNHEQLPTFITKDRFITEFSITGPLDIERELQRFQEAGYVVIEGNSITFTEKFLSSWQKTYELQEKNKNVSHCWSWDCDC